MAESGQASRVLLSLCMIVRNERETLARCLRSVRGLADETVVVDTGSADGTQDLARAEGARLIQTTWKDDFSNARNLGLEQAIGRWILVLDADEYLTPDHAAALRTLLETPPGGMADPAFSLINKSTSDGGRSGLTGRMIRVFPNRADVRYEWPVHEQVAASLARARVPVVDTDVVVLHTGYADPVRNRAKQLRNRAILERQIAAGAGTPWTHFLLGGCHLDLGDPGAALVCYEASLAGAEDASGSDVVRAAEVRIVSCLAELKRWPDAIARMPHGSEPDWHPELVALRAEAEAHVHGADAAREWHERILACADRPWVPACNVSRLKIGALRALGESWYAAGCKARAVALLRAAKTLYEQGGDFTPEDLKACYAGTD